MLKGFALFYLISMLTRNPILALVLVFVIFAVADKAYFGFLPDFTGPIRRNTRIKTLRAELAVNPANAAGAQELGVLYFEKDNYTRALEYLLKAQEKVTNSPRLYLYAGMAYMELGQDEAGREALEKALTLDPKVGYGLAYIYLLRYELAQGRQNREKTGALEDGLNRFAGTENFYRMGKVYANLGDRAKARGMFERAIDEYSYVPRRMRRIHRKWAILARLHKMMSA